MRAALALPRALIIVLPLAAPALPAQEMGHRVEAELSASLFFGNTEQTLATMRTAFERADSSHALRGEVRFNYGETEDEARGRYVSRRSWIGSANLDWRPFAPNSQFVQASVESSLEKRIDLRYSGGVGHKVTLVRQESSAVDVSLALLAERTLTAEQESAPPVPDALLARWSARLRARHDFSDRVSFRSETFYRPAFDAAGRFTFSTSTSVAYRMTTFASLRITFQDNYDSEARSRGARTNNDGELVIGLLGEF